VNKANPTRRSRRLNLRALAILGIVVLVAVPGLVGLKALRDRTGRSAFLTEAKEQLAKNELGLAISYLNRYLELNPDDLEALELKAKILADAARTPAQAKDAVQVYTAVLARLPKSEEKGPRAQEARRRLARLSLMIPGQARAAESQAAALLKNGAGDAEAHRLLARAKEYIGVGERNRDEMDAARKEYEQAEKLQPGDVEGAEELAALFRERLEAKDKAEAVLNNLVKSTAGTPAKHAAALLARYRHYSATHESVKAAADIAEATRDDPANLEVRLNAAEAALQKNDTSAARHHLAAIAEAQRGDQRIKLIEGLIDLVERRPDSAIQNWRAGLVRTGGNNAELTWQLAQILLDVGRVAEAEPLISQYRRLVGGEEEPPKARYLRGMAKLKSNRPADAIVELEAIRFKVDKRLEPTVYYTLGQAYEATRDLNRARDAFRQAADLSKEWTSPWIALARLQSDSRPDDAAATLRKGLALMPNDPKLMTALAQILWREQMQKALPQRNWTGVKKILDDSRKAAPGSVELALVEADFYTSIAQPDEAIALLKTAAGQSPRSTELWIALVNALARRGHIGDALTTLDQAIAAAGPQAAFYIARSSLLMLKARNNSARDALVDGLGRVPLEQKALLWKNLGDFYKAQKAFGSARDAYDEWAKLQPENPEPRIAQFELALAGGDDAAIAKALDAVKDVSGLRGYYVKLVRVQDLLRDRPGEAPDAARDARRLEEAKTLVDEIQKYDPQLALGYQLEGRLEEKWKHTDKAIAAYKKAVALNAGNAALNTLVAILVREGRDKELEALGKEVDSRPGAFDQLVAIQALRAGKKDRAEQLAEQAAKGNPEGLDIQVWRAEVLKGLGKPKEAEAALRLLITQKPKELSPRLQLLMLQISQKQTAAAADTVEQIRQNVENPYPELLWGQCYRVIGDVRRADECYREAMKRWPSDIGVLSAEITYFDQTGRRDEVETLLKQVRRLDPSATWATRKLAFSLASHTGNRAAWDEALSLIGPAPAPDDVPDDLLARANVYALGYDSAQRKKAVAILESLSAEIPDQAEIHGLLARLLSAMDEKDRALAHAAKAAAGDRARLEAIAYHASLLIARNDLAAAESQISRLAAIDPDGLPVSELKARLLAARGKPDEGAKVLEKAFLDRVATPDAFVIGEKVISVLTTLKQLDAADRVATRLAEIDPRGKSARATVLTERGKVDEALAQLDDVVKAGDLTTAAGTALALASRPGADPRWLALADKVLAQTRKSASPSLDQLQKDSLLRHLQREHEQEIATYRAMLAMKPTNYLFLNNMAWTLSEEMKQPDQGLQTIDEAVKLAGSQPHVLDTRGVILTRLGKFDEAVKNLESAAADLHDGSTYFHLARAFLKWGKPAEARKYRDRAREAGLARDQLQHSEQDDWDAVMAQ
jgi:tetratricopeptide (TPR) repeat protein